MLQPIRPKDHIDRILPHLPEKYSPLRETGDGLQSVYLAEITPDFGEILLELLRANGNVIKLEPLSPSDASLKQESIDQVESELEEEVLHSSGLTTTEKEQIVKSRRGQGQFRKSVLKHEKACRVTGVSDPLFLIASHIKPWRDASNLNGSMVKTVLCFHRTSISFSMVALSLSKTTVLFWFHLLQIEPACSD